MARQSIGIGTTANDRTGDPLRTAFQKTNSNFIELYGQVQSLVDNPGSVDRSWVDSSTSLTYDIVEWTSGTTVEIVSTPFETYSLTTYDARSNSQYVYFAWDQAFIDDVWDGYNNPQGEGEAYELSFDGGTTWFAVETSGYNGGTFFYFSVPYANDGQYTFTYSQGLTVQVRFNRGSLPEVWFDLANSPVSVTDDVVSVNMSIIANPRITSSGNTVLGAVISSPSVTFTNALYNDVTGDGSVQTTQSSAFGDNTAITSTNFALRRSVSAADAGRLYCNFNGGRTGFITLYWNAKIFTRS